MRSVLLAFSMLLTVVSGAQAVEPVNDRQLMLYYEVPIGGDSITGNSHSFGLRLDRTSHAPREVTTLNQLRDKTAVFDFRAGKDGIESFKVHGIDYTSSLIVARAATEETPEEGADGATAEEGEGPVNTAETGEKKEKTGFAKTLSEVPFGVVIGGLLFIGIMAGAGD